MGRSVDIDVAFASPVNAADVIAWLRGSGLSPVVEGVISYHLTDEFDWTSEPAANVADIAKRIAVHSAEGDTVGIAMVWPDTEFGVSLLCAGDGMQVSFLLSATKKLVVGSSTFVDFGWYLNRLVPALEPHGLLSVVCHDTYP